jgi:hypothetical protein
VSRDVVLARLAEAVAHLTRMRDNLDEALGYFLDPRDDKKKKERVEIFDALVDDAGSFARLIEEVQDEKYDDISEADDGEEEDVEPAADDED